MFLSIQLHSFLYVYKTTASPHQKDGSTQVTAYSEQTFLERLKKKQEAEESLRMGSGVSDTKLRDAVTNIGASSSSIGRDKSKTSDGGNSSSSSSSNSISSRSALSKNRGDKTSTTSSTATSKGGGSGENKSSKSTASSSRSGKSNGSKSGGTAAGNAKDNPKLIKNFFQSLLNPKEKKEKRRSSSRNKSSK